HPYEGLLIATKAGLTRPGPDQWIPNGRPAYLIAQAKGSLRKLGVEQIDLWQLHRIDPRAFTEAEMAPRSRCMRSGAALTTTRRCEGTRGPFPISRKPSPSRSSSLGSTTWLSHSRRPRALDPIS